MFGECNSRIFPITCKNNTYSLGQKVKWLREGQSHAKMKLFQPRGERIVKKKAFLFLLHMWVDFKVHSQFIPTFSLPPPSPLKYIVVILNMRCFFFLDCSRKGTRNKRKKKNKTNTLPPPNKKKKGRRNTHT